MASATPVRIQLQQHRRLAQWCVLGSGYPMTATVDWGRFPARAPATSASVATRPPSGVVLAVVAVATRGGGAPDGGGGSGDYGDSDSGGGGGGGGGIRIGGGPP